VPFHFREDFDHALDVFVWSLTEAEFKSLGTAIFRRDKSVGHNGWAGDDTVNGVVRDQSNTDGVSTNDVISRY
jgi:hypothetical protein